MAADVLIREATLADVADLAPNLAKADLLELAASSDKDPADLVRESFRLPGVSWAGFIDKDLVALFGVGAPTVLSEVGIPWLLGTETLRKRPVTFLRYSRPFFDQMKLRYPKMENWVYEQNIQAVRWLKWLGFDLRETVPRGPRGEPFIRFTWGL